MLKIREANYKDLEALLELYTHLSGYVLPKAHENDDVLQSYKSAWSKILADENQHIIVLEAHDQIVSSCVLIIIPNLSHLARPYALIENVVTASSYRKQGHASACLSYAKELALLKNCYKIMLMTGSKLESTLKFYENNGYNSHDKTAFIQWLIK